MRLKGRAFSLFRYLTGNTPWVSDQPKDGLIRLLNDESPEPGYAIDLGCGTGASLIALAKLGWSGVGIDHVMQPLLIARRKARLAGVREQLSFVRGDIRRLDEIDFDHQFDLALDLGCSHSLDKRIFPLYVASIARKIKNGGYFLLFAYLPSERRKTAYLAEDLVLRATDTEFSLLRMVKSESRAMPTCWYYFRRKG